ncbi:MAG: hypothetical protein HWQ35_28975 [Nostoc sp. NMS1]|uniref:hypothetical protein n=1 Tax=unclassified Nostoc TaxID=2593658 RepID=UPI0025D4E521|nr:MULTISPECIES: hypothetical protein [unclassified Nostoc]MBN3910430.1 hypothetical protein [Nostoc sp. NMS1]MBN3992609.1 hypothetical protein [Nostoc sp. NMS2]
MNTLELKPGDKIGVFFYDDKRGAKAVIEEVIHISSSGTITLKNGTRYNRNGREVGALGEGTYLCTTEKAQAVIEKAKQRKQQKEEEYKAYIASPEGRRDKAAASAVNAAIKVLNQYGWYADVDGHMDAMESEIEQIIKKYVSEHEPIS